MNRTMGWTLAVVMAAAGSVAAVAQPPLQDLGAERRALMRQQLQAVRAIAPVAQDGGDLQSVREQAEALVVTSRRKLELFPPGSDRDDDRARPEIWTHRAEFDRAGQVMIEVAERLVAAVAAGDRAALQSAFQATRAACSACHERFQFPQRR
jgi:cytochrome c556